MKHLVRKLWAFGAAVGLMTLVGGCDGSGVGDIIYGALQLAFGIITVAT